MAGPKIVVIGAGSFFFGKPVIWKMTHSEILAGGTLALVDTDKATLDTMMSFARRTIDATGADVNLVGSTDRREVMKDADFVVLTYSYRNAHYRGIDCEVSAKYGVPMCSGDTIGPGGVFRALREIPTALAVAKDVEALAPDAWVVNFVNPTTVMGMALMRYAPNVRSFALCDGLHEPRVRQYYLRNAGILPADATAVPPEMEKKLDLRVCGVNHFTWLTRFVYDGKDMMPRFREFIASEAAKESGEGGAKAKWNKTYALDLFDTFGAYPACIAHTKEYVPFYLGYGVEKVQPGALAVFDAADRQKAMDERMAEVRAFASGEKPLDVFLEKGSGDHATDIIETMWGGLGKPFYINTANRGAVSNMAADAFLELRSDVDMHGPRPQPMGELPRGVLGLSQQVLDTHELTAEAGATFDRGIVLRALATDPICLNLSDARKIVDEIFEREKDALDPRWYA